MKTAAISLVVLLAMGACSVGVTGDKQGGALLFGGEVEGVCGKVAVRYEYGPPHWGETPKIDKKLRVTVLQLSTPLQVSGSKEPGMPSGPVSLTRLQVIGATELIQTLVDGEVICVSGYLSQAVSGHHFEKAQVNVSPGEGKLWRPPAGTPLAPQKSGGALR